MFSLAVGGIKGEPWTDIELNFITSPGFIWKGSRLTTIGYLQKFYWQIFQVCKNEVLNGNNLDSTDCEQNRPNTKLQENQHIFVNIVKK